MGPRRLICGAAVLGALIAPGAADGFYGRADLVSADYDRLEQGDDSTVYATISASGRYVVMQTRARNFFADDDPDPVGQYRAGGVFRFDLETRDIVKVADGDLLDESTNAFLRRGASNPAVSADGRFVAFATVQPLVAQDLNDNVDVYVRDMDVAFTAPGAYELISARDGGPVPAAYGPPQFPIAGSNPGADASRGVSISADGRLVVFRTETSSDLPARPTTDTPAGQVFLRDRQSQATRLITRTSANGDPAGGALGAAISGDGSAVAWTGQNAPAQTRFLNGEQQDPSLYYYLYQRVADGPAAPTRRITGVSDPDDSACPPAQVTHFDLTSMGPCFGPITEQESLRSSIIAQLPVMSADGYTVAYLTGSGPRPLAFTGPGLDTYVTDMRPGISRKQGTLELTRATASTDAATSSPIGGLAMSADGNHLAIATVRTSFVLGTLAPTGPFRAVASLRELYVADLQRRTLDRAVLSNMGTDSDGDVQAAVGISGDGERLAFTSFAGNLFFGDANQRPDAFVVTRTDEPPASGAPPVDLGPSGTITSDELPASATVVGKGLVKVTVQVPTAGGVKVDAVGGVGKPRRSATLSTGTARSSGPGSVEVLLRVVRRYRAELKKRGRLPAFAEISFVAAAGGARAETGVGVAFRQKLGGRKRQGKR